MELTITTLCQVRERVTVAAIAQPKTFAVARAGDRITRVEARNAHGLAVEARLDDGWILAVIEGRILQLVGYDEHGTEISQTWLP